MADDQTRRRQADVSAPRGQSRTLSLVEAMTNVIVGFAVALLTQMALFPLVGLRLPVEKHLAIGLAFTAVSLARSYLLRRLFERLGGGGA